MAYMQDFTKNQQNYDLAKSFLGQAVQPIQGANAATTLGKILTAYFASKGMRGAQNASELAAQEQKDTRKLDMARAISALKEDTPYQPGPDETFDETDQLPAGLMNRGTGNNQQAMIEAMIGAETPDIQNLGISQLLTQKDNPDYTLGSVRYSGKTNKPVAVGAEDKEKADKRNFDVSAKLREKFEAQTKDFVKVRDAFGRIIASAQDPSAAGDMALIFNYMKVLDPGSTVREGEFATAQNAGGVDDKIRSAYNSIVNGKRLSPLQRQDFTKRGKMLYESQLSGLNKLESEYTRLAESYSVDPSNVVVDYKLDFPELPPPIEPEDSKEIDGKKYLKINGEWYEES